MLKYMAMAHPHHQYIYSDPNGPVYYKGVYHLFYQYNPQGPIWGNISWAHSISYNLIDWVHVDIALRPNDPNLDINGCYSGSITLIQDDKLAILYTGEDSKNHQVQNLATPKNPSDPSLREWIKYPKPLMTPIDGIDPSQFRDPTTAWLGPDNIWRVTIGARQMDGKWMAFLYKSRDFENWTRSEETPLYLFEKDLVVECLDFFPVGIKGSLGDDDNHYLNKDQYKKKYALKVSFQAKEQDCYILGQYSAHLDEFKVESDSMNDDLDLRMDYGKFYASKSFYDPDKKRRVVWGWIMETESRADDIKKGWSGLMSFPRTIVLSESGKQLIQWPIEEIEKLRGEKISVENKDLHCGSLFEISGVTTSQADLEVSFEIEIGELKNAELLESSKVDPQELCKEKNISVGGQFGPFGLLVLASDNMLEQTAIYFRIFKIKTDDDCEKYVVLMCSDQSRSSLRDEPVKTTYGTFLDLDPLQEKITLRTLIDHSIVESFGGEGRSVITARVYPKLAIDKGSHLYAFNYGTKSVKILKLNAWSMKNAQFESKREEEEEEAN
ncbi:beta-fructofuranosidase, insoluble isoenzyme CWINV3 isoform X1 [Cannabis sativa]|uniref:beta-fructofuranosidase, insoluble isoenzyme CWINV3 isoform X1 n=1 Tax=Cannabis sativa TaxID=3483 RepID=UPI0029CA81FB|nr:beta-fructofuranosidase, insoluble isoenzyme CWINV3 isoform X1 [Cannabis sativa]